MISICPANKSNYYYIKSISTKVFYFYLRDDMKYTETPGRHQPQPGVSGVILFHPVNVPRIADHR